MNWQAIRGIRHERVGAFLALLIVVFLPNYGILKYGPSPVVPAFLLFLLGLWLIWRERQALFADNAQRRWLLVFPLLLVPVLLSLHGSYNPRVSLGIAVVLSLYFFSGVALIRALRADAERTWLVKWLSIVLVFWIVDASIQYLVGHDLFGVSLNEDGRVHGPFHGNLRLATFLAILLPILIAWLLPRGTVAALTGYAVASTVAMLSGVRSAMVFLSVVTAGLFLRLFAGRKKWLFVAVLVVAVSAALALSPVLQKRFDRFAALQQNPGFETIDHFLSGRLTIAHTAANMVAARPFTGMGAGAFQAAYPHYSTLPEDRFLRRNKRAYHAHHLYVGLAAETGLIGLAAFLAIIVLAVRWYWQAPVRRREMAWPFALALLVYVFPVNSQPVLFQQWLFPVLLLLLAAMLAALQEPSAEAAGDAGSRVQPNSEASAARN